MATSRLSIVENLYTTIGIAIINWKVFLARLWLPLVMLFFIEFAGYLSDIEWLRWVLWCVWFPVYVVFAVSTHRLYLLGPEEPHSRRTLVWGQRETRFLYLLFALTIGPVVGAIGFLYLSPVLGLLVLLGYPVASYISARLALVLPATAIDQPLSFRDSWDLSKDQQVFVLGVVIGVPIFFTGIAKLVALNPHSFFPGSAFASLAGMVMIGCLSLAYQKLVGEHVGS